MLHAAPGGWVGLHVRIAHEILTVASIWLLQRYFILSWQYVANRVMQAVAYQLDLK